MNNLEKILQNTSVFKNINLKEITTLLEKIYYATEDLEIKEEILKKMDSCINLLRFYYSNSMEDKIREMYKRGEIKGKKLLRMVGYLLKDKEILKSVVS